MNDRDLKRINDDAQRVVDEFVATHRAAAIPALIGACVLWAVNHGGGDVLRGTLKNAGKLSRDLEQEVRRQAQ